RSVSAIKLTSTAANPRPARNARGSMSPNAERTALPGFLFDDGAVALRELRQREARALVLQQRERWIGFDHARRHALCALEQPHVATQVAVAKARQTGLPAPKELARSAQAK